MECFENIPEVCLQSCSCPGLNVTTPDVLPVDYQANVAIAFILVTAAGLSTTIGAALVFCNRCVTETNHMALGGSLGFSSGVMLFVSFVEILVKAIIAFEDCDCLWHGQSAVNAAYTASLLCFFAGVAIVFLLDRVVHCLYSRSGAGHGHSHGPETLKKPHGHSHGEGGHHPEAEIELDDLAIQDGNLNHTLSREPFPGEEHEHERDPNKYMNQTLSRNVRDVEMADWKDTESQELAEDKPEETNPMTSVAEKQRLTHMGLMTAAAIGLHNFPEGLATFVAALADPMVGAGLAVAIAIHNIPEGLCVSIPIYYATGSRWKGFIVAFFSGITELIGAALGYGFLMAVMGPGAYAVLFGLVAGMMVTIVVKELLPTAHRYDPQDRVVTISIFVGMAVMALSLMLFRLA